MDLEVTDMNTGIHKKNYSIINLYLPPNTNINKNELESLINKLENDFIIPGDMDAYHQQWYSQKQNH